MTLRILFVEDREDEALLVVREITRAGYQVAWTRVETGAAMRQQLAEHSWDLIISDFSMPAFTAPEALEVLKSTGLDLPLIIVSGTVGEETAVAALKAGAHDFLSKHNLKRLIPALERELREAASRRERRSAEQRARELEEQMRQAQKLEAIGQLAGSVAHDFNNILTAIEGYAGLVLDDLSPADQHYHDVSEILSAAKRAASFTRQLLMFSRKQVTKPEHLPLNDMVSGMRNLLTRVLGEQYELRIELDPRVCRVFMDAGHLSQVIMNLVVNARDAMPRGGTIAIRTHWCGTRPDTPIRCDDEPAPGPYAVLCVQDTGEGIPADQLDHIFEPFYTTKDATKGTGLGLSTVYGIVMQSNGFLTLNTELGRGTCFCIYLPEDRTEPQALAKPSEHKANGANGDSHHSVLVVEDDPAIRNLLRRSLERAGMKTVTAADGPSAINTLEQMPEIDTLVSDMMLPGMTGLELMEWARSLRPSLRTVLISGYSSEDLTLPAGHAFLEKPFVPEDLIAVLRELSSN